MKRLKHHSNQITNRALRRQGLEAHMSNETMSALEKMIDIAYHKNTGLGDLDKTHNNNMSSFKERLVEEKAQLNEKIEKLEAFVASENFSKIEAVQMSLLNAQLFAMKTYSQILVERLAWLKD